MSEFANFVIVIVAMGDKLDKKLIPYYFTECRH